MIRIRAGVECEWTNSTIEMLKTAKSHKLIDKETYGDALIIECDKVHGAVVVLEAGIQLKESKEKAYSEEIKNALSFYQEQLVDNGQLDMLLIALMNNALSGSTVTFSRAICSWDMPRMMYISFEVCDGKLCVIAHARKVEVNQLLAIDLECIYPHSDIPGAKKMGMTAILVHREISGEADCACERLLDILEYLDG